MGKTIEESVRECKQGNVVEIGFRMPNNNVRTLVGYFREYGHSPRPGTCRLAYPDADKESRGIFVETQTDTFSGVVQTGQSDLYIPLGAIKDLSILRK